MSDDDNRLAALGSAIAELRARVGNRSYGYEAPRKPRTENQYREAARAATAIRSGAAWRAAELAELENRRIARTRSDDRDARAQLSDGVRPPLPETHAGVTARGMAGSADVGIVDDALVDVDAAELYRIEQERRRGSGKRVLVPRDIYRRVYEGSATPDEIARARNRPNTKSGD